MKCLGTIALGPQEVFASSEQDFLWSRYYSKLKTLLTIETSLSGQNPHVELAYL